MNGNPFPGMQVGNKWCETAREAAKEAGVSVTAIYNRLHRGFGRPLGPKPKHVNIEYRGKIFPTVKHASEAEGVSEQAVRDYINRRAKKQAARGADAPDLPELP